MQVYYCILSGMFFFCHSILLLFLVDEEIEPKAKDGRQQAPREGF
jgi:hypothetical protein